MGFTLNLPMTEDLWLTIGGLKEDDIPHRWELGSRGSAHCADCLDLAGEVRSLGEWQNSVMPGSGCLSCGSGCRCRLEPTMSMPTTYTIFLPFGLGEWINRALLIRDASRNWRFNFTDVLHFKGPGAISPFRSPSASLPKSIAGERRPWWDEPVRQSTGRQPRRPVHGVD